MFKWSLLRLPVVMIFAALLWASDGTPKGSISGRVRIKDRSPLAGAVVGAFSLEYYGEQKRYLLVESANTRTDGTYLLAGLNPGKYYVVALPPEQPLMEEPPLAQPRVLLPTYYPFASSADEAIPITVTPGAETKTNELTITDGPAYSVCGKAEGMLDNLSNTLSLLLIRLGPESSVFPPKKLALISKQDSENGFCFQSVSSGDYAIELQGLLQTPEGNVPVTGITGISVSTHDLSGIRIQAESATSLKGAVHVEDSVNRQDAYARLLAPIPIYDDNQQVISLEPNPNVALLPIRAQPLDPKRASSIPGIQGDVDMRILFDPLESFERSLPPLSAQVSDRGRFALKAVPVGRYRVLAEDLPLGFFLKGVRYQGGAVSSDSFEVVSGSSGQLDLLLSGDAVFIRGTAMDAKGNVAPNAAVSLLPVSESQTFNEGRVARTTTTTSDGQFAFWNLPPGSYSVWAWQKLDSPGLATNPSFLHAFASRAVQIEAVNPADPSYVVQVNLVPSDEVSRGGWQ